MASYDVNKDLVLGDDLYLYLTSDKKVLAFATSCSLQIDGETIDTANKMSCAWNATKAGKNSYTISADALYTQAEGDYSFDALMELMVKREAVEWYIGSPVDESSVACKSRTFAIDKDAKHYGGEGLITSLSLSAGNNEVASCSITITGSGEIAIDPITE